LIFDILVETTNAYSSPLSRAIVLEIFRIFPRLPPASVQSTEKSRKTSVIQAIRQFLMSNSPNDIYLFVSCLGCVDVDAWAGTTPDQQASFGPQEYERIMQLLNFPDQDIRKKV